MTKTFEKILMFSMHWLRNFWSFIFCQLEDRVQLYTIEIVEKIKEGECHSQNQINVAFSIEDRMVINHRETNVFASCF